MKKFITGALILLIAIPGFAFNFFNFLNFLSGLVPVLMIIGGALAVYLGIEELKQSDNNDNQAKIESPHTQQEEAQPEKKAGHPSTATSQVTEPPASEEAAPADASVQFKGNIETLVFHSVTCNFASGKNCSMDFTTKEEAEAQGYKPCKICMSEA